jgi:hypothetical protein
MPDSPLNEDLLAYEAVLALIADGKERLLTYWGARWGWTLPTALRLASEEVEETLARCVRQHFGVEIEAFSRAVTLPYGWGPRLGGRVAVTHVFHVSIGKEPTAVEHGVKLAWLTRQEFAARAPEQELPVLSGREPPFRGQRLLVPSGAGS